MGWLFTKGATRNEVIERLVAPWRHNKDGHVFEARTIKHCIRDNVLWAVHDRLKDGERDPAWPAFIGCYLLECQLGYGWGYKDMDETMGPYYYTCPVSYLDLAGEPRNDAARKWREQVRRQHKRRKETRAKQVHR